METVEVVIRINKNTFDAVNELSKFVDGNHIINGYQMKGNSTVGSMLTAIAKGTVLPKGHGKLFDSNVLWDAYQDLGLDFYEAFDFAEANAIIDADEADREVDNG